jgi:crotonobetainyl-CoA:carnitine CoA-transferase CaiB-like acyl-CoA transferase
MVTTSHPDLGGTYWRYAPVLELSDTPARTLPFCVLGEHSTALLVEHGFSEDEVAQLVADGVVGAHEIVAAAPLR